jgi:hypothetical protein
MNLPSDNTSIPPFTNRFIVFALGCICCKDGELLTSRQEVLTYEKEMLGSGNSTVIDIPSHVKEFGSKQEFLDFVAEQASGIWEGSLTIFPYKFNK